MKRLVVVMSVLTLSLLANRIAQAADDPSGTWKWEMTFGDQKREMSLTLKLEGDKLSGSMPGRNGQETQIENASYKEGNISFTVTRARGDRKITMKYSGKLSGDTITGKIEFEREGQAQSRDWEAKRAG